MTARAELSSNLQGSEPQGTASKVVSVALIGPNDAHRQVVAQALSTAQGRQIHEFIDYPADLNDLARMMETKFDVVLVDVDTDESYALQIIAKLADLGPAVMAYSARTDQDLLMSCMRAGACDFLPLPTENGTESQDAPRPEVATVQQVVPKPPAPKPAPAPAAPTSRSNVTPIVTEVRPRVAAEERPAAPAAKFSEPPTHAIPAEAPKVESVQSEFAAWDAVNLRPAAPVPAVKKSEPRLRPSLVTVPDRKKSETVPPPTAEEILATPAAIERPPVEVDIFRSAGFKPEPEPDEAAEKQGAKWVKWILIAAGPVVLALVLLVVFTRPSTPNPAAAQLKIAAPPAPAEPQIAPGSQLIVNATGKQATATPTSAKPSPAEASAPEASNPTPVSPDAMAQQLVAPTRIAGAIKKTATADEPPPAAPAPVAFDDNSAVPGAIFGSNSKPKVAPHVVAISAGIADGMILRKTTPLYPKFAQEAHITGKVVLKATITKQGTIEGVQVISGPKILAPPAVDAVKTWKYRPYMLDNQPVAVETNITIVFGAPGK